MKKTILMLIVIVIIQLSWIVAREVLSSMGLVSPGGMMGYAVDSEERVYIGKGYYKIEVYKDGQNVKTIRTPNTKGYCFYIEEDKLIIGCAGRTYQNDVYDLDGKKVSSIEMSYDQIRREAARRKQIEQNGNTYILRDHHGFKPYEILRNDEVILRMTQVEFFFESWPFLLLFSLGFIAMAILVLSLVSQYAGRKT